MRQIPAGQDQIYIANVITDGAAVQDGYDFVANGKDSHNYAF
jgi:hypothetical protein